MDLLLHFPPQSCLSAQGLLRNVELERALPLWPGLLLALVVTRKAQRLTGQPGQYMLE